MKVIFSDLDGTLLDRYGYSFEAARPALQEMERLGAPLVLCTSKTRGEVEMWRERLGLNTPFSVENGGAIYVPEGYFPFPMRGWRASGGYRILALGESYGELVKTLEAASQESGCRTLAFHSMSTEEIAIRTRLPLAQAELAKLREYDEPFEILDTGTHRLLERIEAHGKRWSRGGRFYHISGASDKTLAVRRLTALYRRQHPGIVTVGLGDDWNDLGFLKEVDVPVLVHSGQTDALRNTVPHCLVTSAPGPLGWNEAVMQILGAEVSANTTGATYHATP